MGAYVSFLVANSQIRKSDKLQSEIAAFKDERKTLTAKLKSIKSQVSSTATNAEKAMTDASKNARIYWSRLNLWLLLIILRRQITRRE
eukprot:8266556-Ditylum_brightwellii.AAC.1